MTLKDDQVDFYLNQFYDNLGSKKTVRKIP